MEDLRVALSNYLLSEFAEYNIVLFTCDKSHLPSAVMHPFLSHYRSFEYTYAQVQMSDSLKNKLWKEIIKEKIKNQARVLQDLNKIENERLFSLASKIKNGDPHNIEAYAAQIYWKTLFESFKRRDGSDIRNVALNYGYSILRGAITRSLVATGLLPCFGVHHQNKYNQFNLADDLIEPFRPFVDYKILTTDFGFASELTPYMKGKVLTILTDTCLLKEERVALMYACDSVCSALSSCILSQNLRHLILPIFKSNYFYES